MKRFFIILMFLASQAHAEFQRSEEETLYLDYPELSLEYAPRSEFRVHAIVNNYTRRVIYVISRFYYGEILQFGAFECGQEFTVLRSSTAGFYDIRCVSIGADGAPFSRILRVGYSGRYEENTF